MRQLNFYLSNKFQYSLVIFSYSAINNLEIIRDSSKIIIGEFISMKNIL